jgi:putrescine transport system ATP-binding protein
MLVTHDQEEAMTLAGRIGIMDNGRLVQVDSPRILYENPKNRFVADFLGTVSFVEGRVTRATSTAFVIDSTPPITVAIDQQRGLASLPEKGAQVTLAIRPEKISLSAVATGAVNEIPVTVEDLAYLGVASNYRVKTVDGQMFKLQQQQSRRASKPLEWGDAGFIQFDPADVIILP